jgi:Zn-dependent protease
MTILMPLMCFIMSNGTFLFGAVKPVPVNFSGLRNPRCISVRCWTIDKRNISCNQYCVFRYCLSLFSEETIGFSIIVSLLNLIPIPLLDGGRILVSLLR